MNNKINIFISTKNNVEAISTDNRHKINVNIPDSLLSVNPDEYFVMRLMSFYCYNTLYNINDTNNLILIGSTKYYLNIGNPNVLDIRDDLNSKFSSISLVITYDKVLNKFIFSNNSLNTINLNIQTCGTFLGLDNNTTYSITANNYITSIYPLSIIGNSSINIGIGGDIELSENNLDNIRTGLISTNNIIFQKIIDKKSNCLICYENQGDNLYEYKLNNYDSINYIIINIYDENLKYLTDIPDWNMVLQFEKVRKTGLIDILDKVREYLYDMLQLIYLALRYYKIM